MRQQKQKKKLKRRVQHMLSLLLIALLILGLIPSSAYATGTTTDLVDVNDSLIL